MRKLDSFVDAFIEDTGKTPAPMLFRLWGGIFTVAAVLGRKAWLRSYSQHTYPNLYVMLIAPPGAGKTVTTNRSASLLRRTSNIHLANSSITHASIIDELNEAEITFIPQDLSKSLQYNSLTIVANELGVLLPEYDTSMMNKLTDIYDGHKFGESRRTKNSRIEIDAPQINLMAAGTPAFLHTMLPPIAWEQGFMSRTLVVYSEQRIIRPLFEETKFDKKMDEAMLETLEHIGGLTGEFAFTKDAAALMETWHQNDGPPAPTHPRLNHYKARRTLHLLKLCMIACADRTDDLTITTEDFQRALSWLIQMEGEIPHIFAKMNSGGDHIILLECHRYLMQESAKTKDKYISDELMFAYLQERVPPYQISSMVDSMAKAGWIKRANTMDGPKVKPIALRSNQQ